MLVFKLGRLGDLLRLPLLIESPHDLLLLKRTVFRIHRIESVSFLALCVQRVVKHLLIRRTLPLIISPLKLVLVPLGRNRVEVGSNLGLLILRRTVQLMLAKLLSRVEVLARL